MRGKLRNDPELPCRKRQEPKCAEREWRKRKQPLILPPIISIPTCEDKYPEKKSGRKQHGYRRNVLLRDFNMYKVVKQSRAVQCIIILLTLLMMITIYPLRMWKETIHSVSNQRIDAAQTQTW